MFKVEEECAEWQDKYNELYDQQSKVSLASVGLLECECHCIVGRHRTFKVASNNAEYAGV